VVVPAIMSLASRTALGSGVWDCTISGLASGNNSSHQNRDETQCSKGLTSKTWCDNAYINDGTTAGGCHHWKLAGACPTDVTIEDKKIETETQTRKRTTSSWGVSVFTPVGNKKRRVYRENSLDRDDTDPSKVCDPIVSRWEKKPVGFTDQNPEYTSWSESTDRKTRTRTKTSIVAKTTAKATLCKEILGNSAPDSTCRDELLNGNSMDAVAITNYLNCATGQGAEGVTAAMVKEIYICYKNGAGTYTTSSGFTLDHVKCGEFLKAICPV
jgi:hypothetical protein